METKCRYSRLTIPNDESYIGIACSYVREVAKAMGFDGADQNDIARAVGEAARNVIQHAFEPSESATFDISCERIAAGIRVIVKDKGLPFDPSQVMGATGKAASKDPSNRAHGIALMKQYMDEVSFHNLGFEGKEVHLIKYIRGKSLADYYEACDLRPFPEPTTQPRPSEPRITFHVRLMKPEEAVEVARTVYKAYGYSYFYDQVYYPERLVQFNERRQVVSAVATTEQNELAGHCAILRPDASSASVELAQAVVKPEFRGRGCLERLTEFLIEEARSRGLLGLYVGAVTSHTFSQRVSTRLGFNHCGLLLGYAPETVTFLGIGCRPNQRETFELEYKYLREPASTILYPPARHDLFVEKIYKSMGIQPQFAVPSFSLPTFTEPTAVLKIKESVWTPDGYASMEIARYGKDVVTQVAGKLKELCLQRTDVITLYVSLSDPLTYHMTPAFEDLGFMVTGVLPGTSCGDALILQYLNNVEIDLDKIRLHAETGRQALDYLRRTYAAGWWAIPKTEADLASRK